MQHSYYMGYWQCSMCCYNVRHDIMVSGKLIVSRCVAESITMIARCFGHEGLCQLREFCTQLTTVIDSAAYLLTISLPDINKVAMKVYDIMT